MRKLLVCPGLPRSGTTYLFKQLRHLNEEMFNPPLGKEINIFNNPISEEQFQASFARHDKEKYYIDFSPVYLIGRFPAIDNIINFSATEKKIIRCLRHPVDQLFAHYLHDIKAHHALLQFGNDVTRPLFATSTLNRYMSMRSEAYRRIIASVGRENVFILNFHKDLAQPKLLSDRLGAFLDLPLKAFTGEMVGPGGWLPYYLYGGDHGIDVAVGSELFRVPPNMLVAVNNAETAVWTDFRSADAANVIAGSATWTRFLAPAQFDILYESFRPDWEQTIRLFGLDEADFAVADAPSSKIPEIPLVAATRHFQRIGPALTRANQCRFVSAVQPGSAQ